MAETTIYFLTVPEAGSPTPGYSTDLNSFDRSPWLSDGHLLVMTSHSPSSVRVSLVSLCVQTSYSYKDICPIELGPTLLALF